MVRMINLNCVVTALLVAFVVSGCQTSNNTWMTAWKERSQSKPKFKGLETNKEEVTYWPYKSDKSKSTVAEMPGALKDKLARKSAQKDRDVQTAELIKTGDQARKNSQWEDARVAYSEALKVSPHNPDVLHRLAIVADKQLNYAEAEEHYQAVLKIRPRDPNLLSDLGYSYIMRGNAQKAETTLKRALEIEPTHKGAMANLGSVYAKQNRYSDAIAMFKAGQLSDGEAQQYLAMFSQPGSPAWTGSPAWNSDRPAIGPGTVGPTVVAASRETTEDLTKLDINQVREKMAREKQVAVQRRWQEDQAQIRSLPTRDPYDDPETQFASGYPNQRSGIPSNAPIEIGPRGQDGSGYPNNPGYANNQNVNNQNVNNQNANGQYANNQYPLNQNDGNAPQGQLAWNSQPGWNGQNPVANVPNNGMVQGQFPANAARVSPGRNDFRGSSPQMQGRGPDATIQQAGGQRMQPAGPGNFQQYNDQRNASQMATQIGMNAGPGSMFPIVPGSEGETANASEPQASFNNRSGGDFAQPPAFQNARNWGGNPNEQAPSWSANQTDKIEGVPTIAPSNPTLNWAAPTSGTVNWQAATPSSTSWANDNATGSGAAGTGIDSGVSLLRADQTSAAAGQQMNVLSRSQSGPNSSSRMRNGNEGSRPYNGTWPNNNSISTGQNQNGAMNGRSPESIEMFGNGPTTNGVSVNPANQNGNSSTGSLPQYPYTPNR